MTAYPRRRPSGPEIQSPFYLILQIDGSFPCFLTLLLSWPVCQRTMQTSTSSEGASPRPDQVRGPCLVCGCKGTATFPIMQELKPLFFKKCERLNEEGKGSRAYIYLYNGCLRKFFSAGRKNVRPYRNTSTRLMGEVLALFAETLGSFC